MFFFKYYPFVRLVYLDLFEKRCHIGAFSTALKQSRLFRHGINNFIVQTWLTKFLFCILQMISYRIASAMEMNLLLDFGMFSLRHSKTFLRKVMIMGKVLSPDWYVFCLFVSSARSVPLIPNPYLILLQTQKWQTGEKLKACKTLEPQIFVTNAYYLNCQINDCMPAHAKGYMKKEAICVCYKRYNRCI